MQKAMKSPKCIITIDVKEYIAIYLTGDGRLCAHAEGEDHARINKREHL